MYILIDTATGRFAKATGKHLYSDNGWSDDIAKAYVFKTRRIEKGFMHSAAFASGQYELVPVKLIEI